MLRTVCRTSLLLAGLACPNFVAGASFISTGSLITSRYLHTATLLPSGKVLVAGGSDGIDSLRQRRAVRSSLRHLHGNGFPRHAPLSGTRRPCCLPARSSSRGALNGVSALSSAELYDPASGTFTSTGSLATVRIGHTATLLPSGKVLVVGGFGTGAYLNSAELYDPASGTFTATGSLATARSNHTATLLPSGKVLVVGGADGGSYLSSAELYDPASGTFTATGSLAAARSLPHGDAAAFRQGPCRGGLQRRRRSEQRRAVRSGLRHLHGHGFARHGPRRSTRRPCCLPARSSSRPALGSSSAELYDPASGTFTATGSLATARQLHTATLLPSGKVLVAGGHRSEAAPSCTTRPPAPSRPRVPSPRLAHSTRRPCCLPARSSSRAASTAAI